MRFGIAVGAVLGVLAAVMMVAWYGMSAVGDALELAGWTGLAAIVAFHFLPMAVCALAWRALFAKPRASALQFIWIRWLRDAGSDLLALLPGGGEVLGIRAMKLVGVEVGVATAMMAQIAFHRPRPHHPARSPAGSLMPWTLLGLAASSRLPRHCSSRMCYGRRARHRRGIRTRAVAVEARARTRARHGSAAALAFDRKPAHVADAAAARGERRSAQP
jgi:hypothetical protein